MDLVLICHKQARPYIPLSHTPEDCLQRAEQIIGQYAQNGNRQLLYLHFVGELLRSASCSSGDWTSSQEWFFSALQAFDRLHPNSRSETTEQACQLALFESHEAYHAPR